MRELTEAFLIVSLFFPRISLLFLWAWNMVPANPTPLAVDVLLSLFLPRILVLILIAASMGFGGWFWVHAVVALLVYAGSVNTASDRYNGN